MKGVILAAGKGSRLFPITHHIPKPLLPLANRMTLEYAFDRLKEMGIKDVCVVVGENEPLMRNALGEGTQFGLQLTYVRQTEPKGLAHAVSFAEAFVGDDNFVLYLGDAIYDADFAQIVEKFNETKCANLNLVKPVEDPRRFGVATVDGDRITKLVEKPAEPESNLAMAGLYIFGPQIWKVLPTLQPSARGEYEITDAIQTLIDEGQDVRASVFTGTWFDTGTLDSYLETSQFLTNSENLLGENASCTGTFGHHVVIGDNAEVECTMIEDSVVLPGAKVKVNGAIRHCIIGGDFTSEEGIENQVCWG